MAGEFNLQTAEARWQAILCVLATILLAFCIRLIEWPSWQNPEYRYDGEMLLATNDAYHWLAGAVGFGLARDHPMAEMLRLSAWILNLEPANVAFWYPPFLASILAGLVAFWAWILGGGACSMAAGLMASIAPGFLARTLLGYYDTDLVTLLFPLLMVLGPALFCLKFFLTPKEIALAIFGRAAAQKPGTSHLSWRWGVLLAIFGLITFFSLSWHSVFPYLCRFNVAFFVLLALALSPTQSRRRNLAASLCYCLPALTGLPGLLYPAIFIVFLASPKREKWKKLFYNPWILLLFFIVLVYFSGRGEIAQTIISHANAYLKRGADTLVSGANTLVYPSVAQSIIEVQDLGLAALFPYFHPWQEGAIAGLLGFFWLMYKKPATIFLLPLLALGLLSQKLGGRMVMFGAPIVALGFALPACWLVISVFRGKKKTWAPAICCVALLCGMVAPYLDMIPALSQGPSIGRRHAEALARAGKITPPDAMLWLWWDFGYAAHYFARRQTICDGARHSGPSLYLPAAVYATDNARFARQIIAQAAKSGPEAGDFFKGLNADRAQELLNILRSKETPLVESNGRQYIVASFENLRLGFWISNYGSWNFITRGGEGGALSILPQALSYQLKTGQVRLDESDNIIFPTSINVFETTGLIRKNYVQEWFDSHRRATQAEAEAWLATRRNINFLLNRVTDEKIAADQTIYNSMLAQLLVCDPRDPAIAPYFRLVYDNVFARVWEVLPAKAMY